jgi:glyoxylase-like metal-dependent hydrolase (beta-lactamase superfamily II)
MKNTRVAILDGGEMFTKEYMVYWNYPSEKPISMPTYGVLIDHAEGRFIFDTGFDLHHFNQAIAPNGARQSERQTLPGQLDLLGLRPKDIDVLINSHYHFDHCGGNKHCPQARTICHKCELEAARKPEPFEAFVYSDRSFETIPGLEPDIEMHTRHFETVTGDQEIAKGLHLLETPGHTLGHYSLLIELANRRPMLFTADCCYTHKSLEEMRLSSAHVDPVRGYRSMQRVKEIAAKYDAEIFYGHDAELYPQYLKAPAWYC